MTNLLKRLGFMTVKFHFIIKIQLPQLADD